MMAFKVLIVLSILTLTFLAPIVTANFQEPLYATDLENELNLEHEHEERIDSFKCSMKKSIGECCGTIIKKKSCIKIEYNGKKTTFKIKFTFGEKALIEKEIAANNPPPVCKAVPYTASKAEICLDFYNIEITKSYFNICLRVKPTLVGKSPGYIEAGCLNINLDKLG